MANFEGKIIPANLLLNSCAGMESLLRYEQSYCILNSVFHRFLIVKHNIGTSAHNENWLLDFDVSFQSKLHFFRVQSPTTIQL